MESEMERPTSTNNKGSKLSESPKPSDEGFEPTVISSDDRTLGLEAEVADLKDRLLRIAAESENVKRRLEKEKLDSVQYASEKLLQDLMPVLDAFSSATANDKDKDIVALREGMLLVQKMLVEKLERHGLSAIESLGKPFDPNLHQAIQKLESDEVQGETVTCEYAKGYTLHGRLLRPSTVQVTVPNEAE